MTMVNVETIDCRIPREYFGKRLDQTLAELLPSYSRSRLQQWIKAGYIKVDGRSVRPRDRVAGGEWVTGLGPTTEETAAVAQAIPLDIRFEDAHILVVNKPPGLVVHPAVGNPDGTLLNALLHHAPELAGLPRAGLVHRLDKDTSGLLVVARSLRAHTALVQQLQARTMGREYEAVVSGVLIAGGRIEAGIGRHPVDRKRMAVVAGGKYAATEYRVVERFRRHTHLRIRLETGRTHQIRVHMAHRGFPLLGDPVYGGRLRLPPTASPQLMALLRDFGRQALHAGRLALLHPDSGEPVQWRADLPADMVDLLRQLTGDRDDARENDRD
jgi:23S rRNA pseudouridine1911/1915/1917 synthase